MTTDFVVYEGMTCSTCDRPLFVREVEGRAEIYCHSCGVLENKILTNCRGGQCTARIFFGGPGNGKSPINVASGVNHFTDCVNAGRFRR